MKYWGKLSLGKKILLGIFCGILLGLVSPDSAKILEPVGEIFLRLLKMLMVPLVFFSIAGGVANMKNTKQLCSIGIRFMVYILVTSGLSALIGLYIGSLLHLGTGTTELINSAFAANTELFDFVENFVNWIPENIIKSMAEAEMLPVIVFSVFLGSAILAGGKKTKLLSAIVSQMGEVMLKMTEIVMAFSPFGIASLMATMITTLSGAMMKEVLVLILALYSSGIFLLCFIYPLLIGILGKQNPLSFMKKISEPMMVAVSTTSSAATLPVSMRTAQEKLLISESIYGFTLPLGNTCGMNGFALFLGLFCIFASNIYGYPISFSSAAQYVFLGIVLSVGAAGVKGAGIVMTTVLLETLGMPLTVIPVLAAIWPVLDPMLTLLNNTSDLVGTAIVSRKITK